MVNLLPLPTEPVTPGVVDPVAPVPALPVAPGVVESEVQEWVCAPALATC